MGYRYIFCHLDHVKTDSIKLLFYSIDHTYKVYIGGAQKRPDGNYSRPVLDPKGEVIGQVAEGNRKDIRDAVEAAHKAAPGCVTCDINIQILASGLHTELLYLARRVSMQLHVVIRAN